MPPGWPANPKRVRRGFEQWADKVPSLDQATTVKLVAAYQAMSGDEQAGEAGALLLRHIAYGHYDLVARLVRNELRGVPSDQQDDMLRGDLVQAGMQSMIGCAKSYDLDRAQTASPKHSFAMYAIRTVQGAVRMEAHQALAAVPITGDALTDVHLFQHVRDMIGESREGQVQKPGSSQPAAMAAAMTSIREARRRARERAAGAEFPTPVRTVTPERAQELELLEQYCLPPISFEREGREVDSMVSDAPEAATRLEAAGEVALAQRIQEQRLRGLSTRHYLAQRLTALDVDDVTMTAKGLSSAIGISENTATLHLAESAEAMSVPVQDGQDEAEVRLSRIVSESCAGKVGMTPRRRSLRKL